MDYRLSANSVDSRGIKSTGIAENRFLISCQIHNRTPTYSWLNDSYESPARSDELRRTFKMVPKEKGKKGIKDNRPVFDPEYD